MATTTRSSAGATRCFAFLQLVTGSLVIAGTAAATEPPAGLDPKAEPKRLVGVLVSGSPADVVEARSALVSAGATAVPALDACLSDREKRAACADVLKRMDPTAARPVLEAAIDRAPAKELQEKLWKAELIASLGELNSPESVAYLERLYEGEVDKVDAVAMGTAWALKNITGRDYGPAQNPLKQCRQDLEAPKQ